MTDTLYRPLTADDIDAYIALRRAVTADAPQWVGMTLAQEMARSKDENRRLLSLEYPSCSFGAFADGELVATAGIIWLSKLETENHKASLWNVLTVPTHRRQSHARHLTQLAVNHAFANHALRVYLAVFVPNPSAVTLYQSLGFNATGCEPEVLNIAGRFMDVQYMSLRRPD